MTDLIDLDRRLSSRIGTGRGIQLSPADLDALVITGAVQTFRDAVAEHLRTICQQRNDPSRSTSAAATSSSADQAGQHSRSSGTTSSESASEALARAQRTSTKGVLRSIASS